MVERARHGRLVAKVFSPNRVDIGRRLVSGRWRTTGMSMDCVDAENEAKRGMWRRTFVKPGVVAGIVTTTARRHIRNETCRCEKFA